MVKESDTKVAPIKAIFNSTDAVVNVDPSAVNDGDTRTNSTETNDSSQDKLLWMETHKQFALIEEHVHFKQWPQAVDALFDFASARPQTLPPISIRRLAKVVTDIYNEDSNIRERVSKYREDGSTIGTVPTTSGTSSALTSGSITAAGSGYMKLLVGLIDEYCLYDYVSAKKLYIQAKENCLEAQMILGIWVSSGDYFTKNIYDGTHMLFTAYRAFSTYDMDILIDILDHLDRLLCCCAHDITSDTKTRGEWTSWLQEQLHWEWADEIENIINKQIRGILRKIGFGTISIEKPLAFHTGNGSSYDLGSTVNSTYFVPGLNGTLEVKPIISQSAIHIEFPEPVQSKCVETQDDIVSIACISKENPGRVFLAVYECIKTRKNGQTILGWQPIFDQTVDLSAKKIRLKNVSWSTKYKYIALSYTAYLTDVDPVFGSKEALERQPFSVLLNGAGSHICTLDGYGVFVKDPDSYYVVNDNGVKCMTGSELKLNWSLDAPRKGCQLPSDLVLDLLRRTNGKYFMFSGSVGNIEIIRCPDGYEVGDVYCTKSDTGVVDYDAQYPFETASYIAREILRKVQHDLPHYDNVAIQSNLIGYLYCEDLNQVSEQDSNLEKMKKPAVNQEVAFIKIHQSWTKLKILIDSKSMLIEPLTVNFWPTSPDHFVATPRCQWLMSNLSLSAAASSGAPKGYRLVSNGMQLCLVDDTTNNHVAHVIGECSDIRCAFFMPGMTSTCITVFDRFILGREMDQDGVPSCSCFFAWKPPLTSSYSITDVHMLVATDLPQILHVTCTMSGSRATKTFFLRLPTASERNKHWLGLLASMVVDELTDLPDIQRFVSDLISRCFNVTRATYMQPAAYNGKEYYDYYTRHILNGWPMNEILSSQGQQTEKIVDQEEFLAFFNAGSKSIKSARAIEMVQSQVARVGPYHRDIYRGLGHFEPELHSVRSMVTIVNHLCTATNGEYLVRNQPDLVRNLMSAISYVPVLHKSSFNQNLNLVYLRTGGKRPTAHLDAWQEFQKCKKESAPSRIAQLTKTPYFRLPAFLGKIQNWLRATAEERVFQCVLPLPGISTYPKSNNSWIHDFFLPPRSIFAQIAVNEYDCMFEAPAIEPLLVYKWKTFARKRYIIITALYILYLIIFAISLTRSPVDQIPWIVIVCIFGFLYLLQEIRQMISEHEEYFWSPYNYIDIGAFVMPIVHSIMVIQSVDDYYVRSIGAYAVLILWIKIVLQLRVFKNYGIMVATIIEIGRHVGPFFLMLLLIMIGFSHAMVVVLHQPFDLNSALDVQFLSNRTGAADFNNVFTSFKYTFYLLTSDGDAYNDWNGVPSTDALRIIFLVFTAIIVLNVLIALMSNIVSKVDSEGRQRWLKDWAHSIAEIELYWMMSHVNHRYFPEFVHYAAEVSEAIQWEITARQKAELAQNIMVLKRIPLRDLAYPTAKMMQDEMEQIQNSLKYAKQDVQRLRQSLAAAQNENKRLLLLATVSSSSEAKKKKTNWRARGVK